MDPSTILSRTKALYEAHLYSSARFMASMLLSAMPKSLDNNTSLIESEALVILADCLAQNHEYKRAVVYYEGALRAQKSLKGIRRKQAYTEGETRIKLVKCCLKYEDVDKAKSVLVELADKDHNAESCILLAKIYENTGDQRSAIKYYELAVSHTPDAIEAYMGLLRLGVVYTTISHHMPALSDFDSIRKYLEAQANINSFEYEKALDELTHLNDHLRHNVDCLLSLADVQLKKNDTNEAFTTYSKIRKIDPYVMEGMDRFANLIRIQGDRLLVNQIARELQAVSTERPETWLAMALYSEMSGNREQALQFVDQASAISLDKRHVESYQLKGTLLHMLGRYQEAIDEYRRAYRLSKDLFVYRGMIETYLAMPRMKEAMAVAKEALERVPRNPISYTLVGLVLAQNPEARDRARKAYETALSLDPKALEPALALSNLYIMESDYQEASEILERYLPYHRTEMMYTRLADTLYKAGNYTAALENYEAALRINKDSVPVQEAMRRLERKMAVQSRGHADHRQKEIVNDEGDAFHDEEEPMGLLEDDHDDMS